MTVQDQQPIPVYIGTYTQRESFVDGKGEGIYIYQMDPKSGELSYRSTVAGMTNPSFLTIAPDYKTLYTVNEVSGGDEGSGSLSAFTIDPITKDLTPLNKKFTHGLSPCYVSTDRSGKYVLVANYGTGSLCVLPIQADGSLGEATHVVEHHGSGPNTERQEGPHAHMVAPTPDGRFIIAVDLGTDEILVYRLDENRGKLLPIVASSAQLTPGTGPRHITFHPNSGYVYAISELKSQVIAFEYDPATGAFHEKGTLSTLPDGLQESNLGAEIQVHPSGRFLYASNRGHDSIAIYAVDMHIGELSFVSHQPTQGVGPRHFCIDASGSFLLAANQDSDTVVTFRVDQGTGELELEQVTEVPTPVCIQLYQPLRST